MFWDNFPSSMNGMSNVFKNYLELLLNKSIKNVLCVQDF